MSDTLDHVRPPSSERSIPFARLPRSTLAFTIPTCVKPLSRSFHDAPASVDSVSWPPFSCKIARKDLPESFQSTAPKSRWLTFEACQDLPPSSVQPLEP